MSRINNTNEIYKNALIDIYKNGKEVEPRNMLIKEKLGYTLVLDPRNNVITVPNFETNVSYAKEELEWYYAATNRIDWSPRINRIWKNYSDDGITVSSAYGHRIWGAHEDFANQWDWVKNELKLDPDSRRAVININYSKDKNHETKDMPCTMYCQLFIRENKLIWHTVMRSNDLYFGFRNDFYCFAEMQKRMAKELGLETGDYIHTAGSMHVYDNKFEQVQFLIEEEDKNKKFDYISEIEYKAGVGICEGIPK